MKKGAVHAEQVLVVSKKPADKMSLRFVLPLVLFYLVVGILLVWLDKQVTTIATYVLGGLLIVFGTWLVLKYFRSDLQQRIAGKDLAIGLILLLTGIVLVISPNSLELILPSVWGLSLIFGGFLKIQYAFDEKSVKVNRWWIMLIFSALSLIIGTLALLSNNVFGEAGNRNLIIGIFMIGEAVLDIITYLLITSGMKRETAVNEAAAVQGQAGVQPVEPQPVDPQPAEPRPAEPAADE